MCGNFNGDISDDMVGKDGLLYKDAISFGQSWQHGRKKQCDVGITQHEVSSAYPHELVVSLNLSSHIQVFYACFIAINIIMSENFDRA